MENTITQPNIVWNSEQNVQQPEEFLSNWLNYQCSLIPTVQTALVLSHNSETNRFSPTCFWPKKNISLEISSIAELAIEKGQGVKKEGKSLPDGNTLYHLAFPVKINNNIINIVAVTISCSDKNQIQIAMQQLQWGIGWLEVLYHRKNADPILKTAVAKPGTLKSAAIESESEKLSLMLNLVATSVEYAKFNETSTAIVNFLNDTMNCSCVSLGLNDKGYANVLSVSRSTEFAERANRFRLIGRAMDEAIDQQESIVWPPLNEQSLFLATEQEVLANIDQIKNNVCSIPLVGINGIIGAITLERDSENPFSENDIEFCEMSASLLAPIIELKHSEERLLIKKISDSFYQFLSLFIGAKHYGLKVASIILLFLVLFFSNYESDYRVVADANLEGAIQRSIVSPLEGYIKEAKARAGDIVKEGELLVSLDERDLVLEQLKWVSQKEQYDRQYRDALAQHQRSKIRIYKAQLSQADAQLNLVNERLKRARITTPFDSIVISGDLSQSLGSPVSKGDILFEIAPLHEYRVILQVDEKNIKDIKIHQTGSLLLSGGSEDELNFEVEKITPVSEIYEGKNVYRIEARLITSPEFLRPGMNGIGKIDIDSRKLIWIWTHHFTDWFRLWFWTWI